MVNPDIKARIRKQYYKFFKHAYEIPGKEVEIIGIFDISTQGTWPDDKNKKIFIKVNDNKMVRVPAHHFTSYFTKKSNQNTVLDELIEDYNSTDDKEAFIKSLENIKLKTVTSESMNSVLDTQVADPEDVQRIALLRHRGLAGGKKSRKLRKNKKRKTRRKNKKRKTMRKK
tara:strand:+ start:564 stop:1076 length:513 start_codon:yes stop_codon:yes gene_type:complete